MYKIVKCLFIVLGLGLLIVSCNNDDDTSATAVRDVTEVATENDQEIISYLETHFYNYEAFENPPENFDFRVVFDTIAADNVNKTALINEQELITKTVNIDDNGTEVPHKLYLLIVREGGGTSPTRVDSTFVRYRGTLLNGTVFDQREQPIWFDLITSVRGFSEGLASIRSSSDIISNSNGTFNYEDYGIGAAFIPSGLAYFNNPPTLSGIPDYAPLIFSYDLLVTEEADHDGDGVPTRLEDINANGDFTDDNTDGDNLANFLDNDDDGDTIPTIEEITIDEQGVITFTDCDGDGTPDYLDADICPTN